MHHNLTNNSKNNKSKKKSIESPTKTNSSIDQGEKHNQVKEPAGNISQLIKCIA